MACLLIAASLLPACGGPSGNSGPAAAGGAIKVTMTDFHFAPSEIATSAGPVSFTLVNAGKSSHDLVVLAGDGKIVAQSDLVQPGAQAAFKIDRLSSGTYRIICDQGGHEQAGMKGTLKVS